MPSITFANQERQPNSLLCIGRNYMAHIEELNNAVPEEMVFFFKPASSLSAVLNSQQGGEPLHYEAEICFLIEASAPIAVGIGLDLTKRATQQRLKERGLPWERAKAFSGAAVLSPFVSLQNIQLTSLRFELRIDDDLQQQGDYGLMINKPEEIFRELSHFIDLQDNDIVMTGTPKGVGQVVSGARYHVSLFSDDTLLLTHEWIAL
ncbi:fumarylacetoacetate hydrolase family protein [Thaumasiovibrio subtropicus]|uniref:fumarylacetoacetate hydrolase family protein n=1 Tax=Thaumasiovibrio subtropicus TaxID=1891207 RepID=UPI001FE31B7E|nr:fumarylacetoacetate hydrolase family protein [Thaumasiovibrio subtropicus]